MSTKREALKVSKCSKTFKEVGTNFLIFEGVGQKGLGKKI